MHADLFTEGFEMTSRQPGERSEGGQDMRGTLTHTEVEHIILRDTFELEREAFMERFEELWSNQENHTRRSLLFYQLVLDYQHEQDRLFRHYLPADFAQIDAQAGSFDKRWFVTAERAQGLQDLLKIGTPQQGGILDFRAKSAFGIWQKMWRNTVDCDEIYDSSGIRITVLDAEAARKMAQMILANRTLMEPQVFRHLDKKVYEPYVDTLDTPNEKGYAHARMSLIDDQGVYEVQIQTLENYKIWSPRDRDVYLSMVASPKWGPVYTLDELGE